MSLFVSVFTLSRVLIENHLEYKMITRRRGITKYTVVAASIMYKVPKQHFML